MPSSSRNLEKVGEPTARDELVTFALEELREDIRAEQKLTHRRDAGEPYDEPRTQASRLGRRGPARQPSVRAASSTGVPTAARAFGDRSIHVLQAHGPHARRRSKTSGEQLIDAKRARTLGDTCRLRRILGSFVRGPLDETQALLKRKPPNRRQNLVDAAHHAHHSAVSRPAADMTTRALTEDATKAPGAKPDF